MTWVVLATGPSMSQAQADRVRGRASVVAVSDAYRLAPWADVLVSGDAAWWRHHEPEFAGLRFCSDRNGWQDFKASMLRGVHSGTNSGVLGIRVARHLGAKRIILLGFDGRGSHFFGRHPEPLKNSDISRHAVHAEQHRQEAFACRHNGVEILNCSPATALSCYPTADLEAVL